MRADICSSLLRVWSAKLTRPFVVTKLSSLPAAMRHDFTTQRQLLTESLQGRRPEYSLRFSDLR